MKRSTYVLLMGALLYAQDVPLTVYENGDFDGIYKKIGIGEVALMETWEDRISSLKQRTYLSNIIFLVCANPSV